MKGQKRTEIILYLVLWAVLFAAPVISMLVGDGTSADWQGVVNAWGLLLMFSITFFIHNFFIAPLLVYRNSKLGYGVATFILVTCFTFYQFSCRPHHPNPRPNDEPRVEEADEFELHPDRPHGEPRPPHEQPNHSERQDRPIPPRAFGGQDSVAFIIMTLLLGLNVGTKYFFKSLDDKKKIKELERENLNRQLEYLKYQINPHFFMNTLNNIHALVDIDPEQAKYTIEVLSKLMRYVLYEGNKTMAPLQKELDFIGHYVDLMKIRYTDKVRISVSLPGTSGEGEIKASAVNLMDIQVPSLLFTTFVENAFKHGVSYQKESFIEVNVSVDEVSHEIEFLCVNSRKKEMEDKHGGVGLKNAKKRLDLIYGNGYVLNVNATSEEYRVLLRLPMK